MRSIRKRLVTWLLLGLALLWATAGAGVYFAVRNGELARLDAQLEKLDGGVRFYGSMVTRDALRDAARDEFVGPPRPERPEIAGRPERNEFAGGPPGGERGGAPGGERGGSPGGERGGAPGGERGGSPGSDRGGSGGERSGPQAGVERFPFFQEDGRQYFQISVPGGIIPDSRSPSLGENTLARPVAGKVGERYFYDTALEDGTRVRAMAFDFRAGSWGRRPRPGDAQRRLTPEMEAVVAVDAEPMHATLATLLLGIGGVGFLAGLASIGLVHFALRDGLRPLDRLGDQLAKIDAQSLDGRFSSKSMPAELAPICDRLNGLMSRLETSFERERRFSADLAHELRTPVAELRTMAEVALRWPDGSDVEQSQQTLEVAEQMGGIIESLLALGRYENGQAAVEFEPVELGELAESCWKQFADTAAAKDLQVERDLPAGQVIDSDPKLLRLILTNLFSNAAEYTPAGGRVEIRAEGATLTVTNDAPGFKPEQVTHLFERFWRADGSRTDGTHSGLGLSLARTCARIIALDLEAHLEAPDRLVFSLRGEKSEKTPASSLDNLALVG